jgi:hypothetical protein
VVVLFARTQLLFTICNVNTALDSLIDRNSYTKTQQDATVYQNFIIPYFKLSSTCFRQHTTHYQEPKTAQAASGLA